MALHSVGNVINLRGKRGSKGLAPWAGEAAQPPPIIPLPLGGGRGWGNLCTTFLKLTTLTVWGDAERSDAF